MALALACGRLRKGTSGVDRNDENGCGFDPTVVKHCHRRHKGDRQMQRRDFVKVSAGALTVALGTHDLKGSQTVQRTTANEKPYGIQYYEKAEQIWNRIATTELPLIAEAADRAVTSLRSNKRIYCQITGGHMHHAELRRSRPGNPDYLHHWSRNVEAEKFDVIGSGDFLLSDFPRLHTKPGFPF